MKKTIFIIFLLIPLISVVIFWYQKKYHENVYNLLDACKEAHLSCLHEKDGLVEPVQSLIDEDLNDYLELKTLKEKYLKADALMAKAFQTFLIIQGIRLTSPQQDWAYKNDQLRSEELTTEWENQTKELTTKEVSVPTIASIEETTFPSKASSPSQIPKLPKPQQLFWNKYFKLNKSNSTPISHNKLNLLKGDFVGTFKDMAGSEGEVFFQLSIPKKTHQNEDNYIVIHLEGIESNPPKNQLLYFEETLKAYQITQNPLGEFYILKNHLKNIEVHLNIDQGKSQAFGKIYVPDRNPKGQKVKRYGDFFIPIKR